MTEKELLQRKALIATQARLIELERRVQDLEKLVAGLMAGKVAA